MPEQGKRIGGWRRLRIVSGCCAWYGIWFALVLLAAMRTAAWWITSWAREVHPLLALVIYYVADIGSLICVVAFGAWVMLTTALPDYEEDPDHPYPPFIQ